MKIYYFSGTGNTLYLGKKIQESIQCELINIGKIRDEEIVLQGKVGILFPVYCMGIPRVLEEFLKKCKVKNLDYLFALGTCGGSGFGIPFEQINNILKGKGTSLDYSEYCHMPDNYIKIFTPKNESEAKEVILSQEDRVQGIIKNIEKNYIYKGKESRLLYFIYILMYKFWRKGLEKNYKNFIVTNSCISCNLCKELCPVKNIEMTSGKPTWGNRCEECLACVHLCPTKAILYGKKSKNGLRYKNPFIKIEDFKKYL